MTSQSPHITVPLAIAPGEIAAFLRPGAHKAGPIRVDREGTAVIPVAGPLQRAESATARGYDGIRRDFDQVLTDPNVKRVIFRINSPGGPVHGLFDLTDHLYEKRGIKPTAAVIDDIAGSAGYAIASAADKVLIGRTGRAGSVGSIALHIDQSKALERAGIKVTEIVAGERKTDGSPYRPLSAAARARTQAEIDNANQIFVATVARNRNLDPQDVAAQQAGLYMGHKAVEAGLADRVVNVDSVLAAPSDAAFSNQGAMAAMIPSLIQQNEGGPQVVTEFTDDPLEQPQTSANAMFDATVAESLRAAGCLDVARDRSGMLAQVQAYQTTSDLADLSGNVVHLNVRRQYQSLPHALPLLGRVKDAPDFLTLFHVQLSEHPDLLRVNEHGEVKSGPLATTKEGFRIYSNGRIVSVTRQAMINDPTGTLQGVGRGFAESRVELEAQEWMALMGANSGLGPTMSDGKSLFHADHGNLAAAGSAISITSLSEARLAMRQQTGQDGKRLINAAPAFLLVPSALETTAETILTEVQANNVADVNPFGGRLQLVVEPRLDAISPTAWYLVADPSVIDGVMFAYLRGRAGPQIQVKQGFEIDGMQVRALFDFGIGFIEWRSWYMNPGA